MSRVTATIAALSLASGIGLTAATSAQAATPSTFTAQSLVSSALTSAAKTPVSKADIAKFDRYVSFNASTHTYSLHIPAAVRRSDPSGAARAARAVSETNASLQRLTNARFVVKGKQVGVVAAQHTGAARAAGPHGGLSVHWWGYTIWLDQWATGRLEAGLAAGSGAAWVAAELTSWTGIGGLSAGAIAALLALGAGAIWLCDWNDNGVGIHVPFWGGAYCWPR